MEDQTISQNQTTVVGLPPNQSLVIADSRQRSGNESETPYSFSCICNSGIVAKEVIYSRLVWNQPLFTHNNTNNELIFQVANDTTRTFVVYAPPFITFTEFDGNNASSVGQDPQVGSYAYAMERMLNTQVRRLQLNTILTNTNDPSRIGKVTLYPSLNIVRMYFRYSSSQGFFIYGQDTTANVNIPIKILPCNYLNRGHSIHGFGILDRETQSWQPRSSFVACYYSDSIPTLLSFNSIAVVSHQLTKDRRLNSFHSIDPTPSSVGQILDDGSSSATLYQGSAEFDSELAVFPVSVYDSCVRHEEQTGLDGSVVSFRWGYQPQEFDISILKGQSNEPLKAGDPMRAVNADGSIFNIDLASVVPYNGNLDPYYGDANIQNALLFGCICNPYARLDDPYTNDRQTFSMALVRPAGTYTPQNWYYSWNVHLEKDSVIGSGINVADCVSSNTYPLDISYIFYVPTGFVTNTPSISMYGITGMLPTVTNITGLPTNYFGGRYNTQANISVFQWIITSQFVPCTADQPSGAQAYLTPKFNGLDGLQVLYDYSTDFPYNWAWYTKLATCMAFYYFDGLNPTAPYTRLPFAYINCGILDISNAGGLSLQFTWKANFNPSNPKYATDRIIYLNEQWPGTPDYPTPRALIDHFIGIHSPIPVLIALSNFRYNNLGSQTLPTQNDVHQGPQSNNFTWNIGSVSSTATFGLYAPIFYRQYIPPVTNNNTLFPYRYSNPEADGLADDLIHEIGVNVGEGY